jgi:protein SCO1/2
MTSSHKALIIFGLFLAALGGYFVSKNYHKKALRTLPYFGPKSSSGTIANDTAHHIYYFRFTNQYNEPFTLDSIKNKIVISEFFFTTCRSICPVMNRNMEKVYKKFSSFPDVLILSHTVDPETDSVPVLKAYADLHGVHDRRWIFLTGKKSELYEAARKSYLVSVDDKPPENPEDDFIHTQMFVLVDKNQRIRGYYDGTDSLEIERLITDIQVLRDEQND